MHTSLLTFHKHRNHPSIFVWCILYVLGELYNFSEIFLILNEEASTSTCMYNIYAMSNMSKYIYMFNMFDMLIMLFYMYNMLFCMFYMFIYMFCMFFYMFYMFFCMVQHVWHGLLHVHTWLTCSFTCNSMYMIYSMDIILLISTQRILKIGSSRLRHANMTCIYCKHNIYMNMNMTRYMHVTYTLADHGHNASCATTCWNETQGWSMLPGIVPRYVASRWD